LTLILFFVSDATVRGCAKIHGRSEPLPHHVLFRNLPNVRGSSTFAGLCSVGGFFIDARALFAHRQLEICCTASIVFPVTKIETHQSLRAGDIGFALRRAEEI
jgi:hypothetical protein